MKWARDHIPSRRGVVLLAVLVLIAISTLAGTSMLVTADTHAGSVDARLRRAQSRDVAVSALRALLVELADQREELLGGGDADLTSFAELYTESDGSRAIFRLVPLGGQVAHPEAAGIDLARADAETLERLDAITPAEASRIASAATSGYGAMSVQAALAAADLAGDAQGDELALLFTAHAADADLQVGWDDPDHTGTRRVTLTAPLAENAEQAIDDRFGEGTGRFVRELLEQGSDLSSAESLFAEMRRLGTDDPAEWGRILDFVSRGTGDFTRGLVDINRAPASVLATIPGIDTASAEGMVAARASLDEAQRRDIAWPVTTGELTAEEFVEAVGHLTVRTLQWRVRVEAGFLPPADDGELEGAAVERDRALGLDVDTGDGDRDALEHAVVLEAVLDVAGATPRIADLRDVTIEAALRRLDADASDTTARRRAPVRTTTPREDESTEDEAVAAEDEPSGIFGSELPDNEILGRNESVFGSPLLDRDESVFGSSVLNRDEDDTEEADAASQSSASPATRTDQRTGRWRAGSSSTGGR